MDIYDNIASKKYEAKDEYPQKPARPIKDIAQTHAAFGHTLDAYEVELVAYRGKVSLWKDKQANLQGDFCDDLAKHHGIAPSDPFYAAMWSIAYDRGHSGGFNEIANYMEDLVPLLKLYTAK
jgi:hypothetical protein